jgi:hypothetical protein
VRNEISSDTQDGDDEGPKQIMIPAHAAQTVHTERKVGIESKINTLARHKRRVTENLSSGHMLCIDGNMAH